MMVISFAWTTPALVSGNKTCTRREWADEHAALFRAGDPVAAYDRGARNGGRQVATITLAEDPYLESSADVPPQDWVNEGFDYLRLQQYARGRRGEPVDEPDPAAIWADWRARPRSLRVVRFLPVGPADLTEYGAQVRGRFP